VANNVLSSSPSFGSVEAKPHQCNFSGIQHHDSETDNRQKTICDIDPEQSIC
jgi:hypothetical protein